MKVVNVSGMQKVVLRSQFDKVIDTKNTLIIGGPGYGKTLFLENQMEKEIQ